MLLWAFPPPVELMVRAGNEAYKSGSPVPLLISPFIVLFPVDVINPMFPPTALDEWEWEGISSVVKVCVSAPPVFPKFLADKPAPVPEPIETRPLISGILKLAPLPP